MVGLAASHGGELWVASCFHVFDPQAVALIIMTDRKTRHGQLMLASSQVAGTVAGQPQSIRDIRGVQFAGRAVLLEPGDGAQGDGTQRDGTQGDGTQGDGMQGDGMQGNGALQGKPGPWQVSHAAALARYVAAHPVARAFRTDLWCIWLDEIKHTENRVAFAQKTLWRRG